MTNDCRDIFTRPHHTLAGTVWHAPDPVKDAHRRLGVP